MWSFSVCRSKRQTCDSDQRWCSSRHWWTCENRPQISADVPLVTDGRVRTDLRSALMFLSSLMDVWEQTSDQRWCSSRHWWTCENRTSDQRWCSLVADERVRTTSDQRWCSSRRWWNVWEQTSDQRLMFLFGHWWTCENRPQISRWCSSRRWWTVWDTGLQISAEFLSSLMDVWWEQTSDQRVMFLSSTDDLWRKDLKSALMFLSRRWWTLWEQTSDHADVHLSSLTERVRTGPQISADVPLVADERVRTDLRSALMFLSSLMNVWEQTSDQRWCSSRHWWTCENRPQISADVPLVADGRVRTDLRSALMFLSSLMDVWEQTSDQRWCSSRRWWTCENRPQISADVPLVSWWNVWEQTSDQRWCSSRHWWTCENRPQISADVPLVADERVRTDLRSALMFLSSLMERVRTDLRSALMFLSSLMDVWEQTSDQRCVPLVADGRVRADLRSALMFLSSLMDVWEQTSDQRWCSSRRWWTCENRPQISADVPLVADGRVRTDLRSALMFLSSLMDVWEQTSDQRWCSSRHWWTCENRPQISADVPLVADGRVRADLRSALMFLSSLMDVWEQTSDQRWCSSRRWWTCENRPQISADVPLVTDGRVRTDLRSALMFLSSLMDVWEQTSDQRWCSSRHWWTCENRPQISADVPLVTDGRVRTDLRSALMFLSSLMDVWEQTSDQRWCSSRHWWTCENRPQISADVPLVADGRVRTDLRSALMFLSSLMDVWEQTSDQRWCSSRHWWTCENRPQISADVPLVTDERVRTDLRSALMFLSSLMDVWEQTSDQRWCSSRHWWTCENRPQISGSRTNVCPETPCKSEAGDRNSRRWRIKYQSGLHPHVCSEREASGDQLMFWLLHS